MRAAYPNLFDYFEEQIHNLRVEVLAGLLADMGKNIFFIPGRSW